MKKLLTILNFIKKYRDVIYIILLIIFCVIISGQISKMNKLDDELTRQENNRLTLVDEIKNYKDELGRSNAEKRAYQLTQEELRDSIGLLKKKNVEYLTYINTIAIIKDTVTIETTVVKENDTTGAIIFEKADTIGKSTRNLSIDIPYILRENTLNTGMATFTINQDIFIEGWLERNTKTNETFIRLRSDYPNLIFNSGTGIVAENSKAYERDLRKKYGVGICIGPNIGIGYDLGNKKFVPTIGLGVTIGFTYTPKWTQW